MRIAKEANRWTLLLATVTSALLPSGAAAQSALLDDDLAFPSDRSEFRLYVGMWTSHLRNVKAGVDNNWLLGVQWRGMFGGTFVNSFGKRSFTAGIQRTFHGTDEDRNAATLGYRLGLVTGYDERFLPVAARSPVLPLAQVVGDVGVGPTRMELAWAGLIASLAPSVQF